jgi:hypothetical protein
MVIPNLIHPTTIGVEQKNSGNTIFDEHTNEPVRQADRNTPVTFQAQVAWNDHDRISEERGGFYELEEGYILVRKVDMNDLGIELEIGDKIVSIGDETGLNLYITRFQFRASYPPYGPTLTRCYFEDRAPTHRTS